MILMRINFYRYKVNEKRKVTSTLHILIFTRFSLMYVGVVDFNYYLDGLSLYTKHYVGWPWRLDWGGEPLPGALGEIERNHEN